MVDVVMARVRAGAAAHHAVVAVAGEDGGDDAA
jgi:hypothetical protein